MFVKFRLRWLRKKVIKLWDDAYVGAYFDICDLLDNVIDAFDGVISKEVIIDDGTEEDAKKEG